MALVAQRLAGPRPDPDRRGILEVIRGTGYLQLDPTNVVARSPLLVLWSRLGRYDPSLVDDLLFRRRELLETASLIVPTSDLPIHAATMRMYRRGESGRPQRVAAWMAANAALRRHVLGRLRREGPLPLTAFEDRAVVGWRSSGWTSERNVAQMLTFLQRHGRVVVAGRRRGQKLWALARGWLPTAERLGQRAIAREATVRAMRALGIGTIKQLRSMYAFGRYVSADALAALEREGEAVRVEIADEGSAGRAVGTGRAAGRSRAMGTARLRGRERGEHWYADPEAVRSLRRVGDAWEERTTLLSPFDNLIIDRERTESLFGLRYRMEIYVPKHLRERGFWAMPILHGDSLIGTVDPRYERERGELVVNAVHLEAGVRGVQRAVRGAVEELGAFVGAKTIRWRRAP